MGKYGDEKPQAGGFPAILSPLLGLLFGVAPIYRWSAGFWLRRPRFLLRHETAGSWLRCPRFLLRRKTAGSWLRITSSYDVKGNFNPVFPDLVDLLLCDLVCFNRSTRYMASDNCSWLKILTTWLVVLPLPIS
ncbi:hypothetical protein DY000_02024157 [Brassica cretica]|uniref:Uncharacterized protein n=1 Tax=Brassica cretica TaxID=69181 RepID=A0ABQ7EK70_BRACR|nr:hypothetical protein DY000_02024157 [Brassica cretica]